MEASRVASTAAREIMSMRLICELRRRDHGIIADDRLPAEGVHVSKPRGAMCPYQVFGGIALLVDVGMMVRSKSDDDVCDSHSSEVQGVAVKRATSQIHKAFVRIAGLCAVSA